MILGKICPLSIKVLYVLRGGYRQIRVNCDDLLHHLSTFRRQYSALIRLHLERRKVSRQVPDLSNALTFLCRLVFAQSRANLVSSGARQNYPTLRCLVLITATIDIASQSVPQRVNRIFTYAFSRDVFWRQWTLSFTQDTRPIYLTCMCQLRLV